MTRPPPPSRGTKRRSDDPTKPPIGSNLATKTLGALVEPYPQAIAGTPSAWSFDRAKSNFTFSYSRARAGGRGSFPAGSVSEIATPALVYGGHYAARVSGGAILSARGAPILRIASCRGATRVSVTVSPSGHSGGSCKLVAQPRLKHGHKRVRAG